MTLSRDLHCIPCSATLGEPVEQDSCSTLTHVDLPRLSKHAIAERCTLCDKAPNVIIDGPTIGGPHCFMCIPCWKRLGFPKSLNMYTSFINVRRDA